MSKKSQSTPESSGAKSKPRHGGRRPGAGRKTEAAAKARAEYHAATQALLIDWLPGLLGNLKRLADGGYERVEETFEDKDEVGELTCVKRVVSVAEPDRAANQYLVDRLLGRPTERSEVGGPDGGPISVTLDRAVDLFYGDELAG